MDEQLYKEYLLSVFSNLKNKRILADATNTLEGYNASCGDKIMIYMKISSEKVIEDVSFMGDGCLLSQVSMELLADAMKGKKLDIIKEMKLEDIFSLVGIHPAPMRVKCMELSLDTVKKLIN